MATAALDALQDVTGTRMSVDDLSLSAAVPSVALQASKLEFYQTVVNRLMTDGLEEEARYLGQRLNLRVSAVGAHAPVGVVWVPLKPRPLPPVAPQERLLDLGEYVGISSIGTDDENVYEDVIEEMAAHQPPIPGVRVRYTSQHKQAVCSVAFSADGRLCASGSVDTSIKIMDTSKMRMHGLVPNVPGMHHGAADELRPVIRTFYDHVGTVSCMSFHPRQPILFTGSFDKTVKIFDLTKGGVNKKAQASISDVSPVRVVTPHACGDYILVGTAHPVVRLYDTTTQQCFSSYHVGSNHEGAINDLKCASDGSVFASASADGTIKLWDGVNNRAVNKLPSPHHGSAVLGLQWSRNNRYLLSTGGDNRIRLWDMRTGKQLLVYCPQPKVGVCTSMTASFMHGEEYIVCSSTSADDAEITLLNAKTGSVLIPKMGVHAGAPTRSLAASPNDNTLISGCEDSKVRYIEVNDELAFEE